MGSPDRKPRAAEDRAFARFCRSGDPDQIARVFDLIAPRLILVAIHLVRDADEAEDLLQITFLEAIQRAQSFEQGRPVLPWLLTILSRRAANRRRDKERRRERPDGDGPRLVPTGVGVSGNSWGVQLHDGLVYVSEKLSGLWIFRPEF